MWIVGCEKDYVADHHEWCRYKHDVNAPVENCANERKEDGEERANNIWRDRMELLRDNGGLWVDCSHNRRSEERKALDGDVV